MGRPRGDLEVGGPNLERNPDPLRDVTGNSLVVDIFAGGMSCVVKSEGHRNNYERFLIIHIFLHFISQNYSTQCGVRICLPIISLRRIKLIKRLTYYFILTIKCRIHRYTQPPYHIKT